jgi:periplasmic protein TonB
VFETFHQRPQAVARRVAVPVIVGGLVVHVTMVAWAWIASVWNVERLEPPNNRIALGFVAAPLPPPPPPAAGAKPATPEPRVHRRRVKEIVQPTLQVVAAPLAGEGGTGDGPGTADGAANGARDGVRGSDGAAPPEVSLAAPPRPLGRYDKIRIVTKDRASRGKGGTIDLILDVDARGHVTTVSVLASVSDALDAQAVDYARKFRFWPARDAAGNPAPSRVRWQFHVESSPY